MLLYACVKRMRIFTGLHAVQGRKKTKTQEHHAIVLDKKPRVEVYGGEWESC